MDTKHFVIQSAHAEVLQSSVSNHSVGMWASRRWGFKNDVYDTYRYEGIHQSAQVPQIHL